MRSYDPSVQRKIPLEFDLKWKKMEGCEDQSTTFVARKIVRRAYLACFANDSQVILESQNDLKEYSPKVQHALLKKRIS